MDTRYRMRLLLLCALCLAVAAAFAGCGGGGGGGGTPPPGGDTTPPAVTASIVYPVGWSFLAGDVTIRANATDAGGIKSVKATVATSPVTNVTLTKTTGSTYQAVVSIPANLTITAKNYATVVTATDNADNTKTSTANITVPESDAPPPPP